MNLYLLRHGIAVERGTRGYDHDADRTLTSEGREKLRAVGAAMLGAKLSLDRIFTSPYTRAEQTACFIADILGLGGRVQETPALLPDSASADVAEFLRGLRPQPDDVLLVGHEPNLSRLVSFLISGRENCGIELKKGGLCSLRLRWSASRPRATLLWLLTPRLMKKMT